MGRFAEQLNQAAMTYVTRRAFAWVCGGVVFWLIATLGIAMSDLQRGQELPIYGTILAFPAMLGFLFVNQAKFQFSHHRAVLLGNFARAHLVALATLLVISVLVLPLACSTVFTANRLGVAAFCATLAALILWGQHRNDLLSIVGPALFISSMFPPVAQWWFSPNEGTRIVHGILFAGGWVAIGAWLWRLTRLREEADDYQQAFVGRGLRQSGETSERRRWMAAAIGRFRIIAWLSDRWHERIRAGKTADGRQFARLLRYGFSAVPIELAAPVGGAVFFGIAVVGSRAFFAFLPEHFVAGATRTIWLMLLVFAIVPAAMVGHVMCERRPRMAHELLFPLRRQQLFDALFLATAWDVLAMWLTTSFFVLVGGRLLLAERLTIGAAAAFLWLSFSIALAGLAIGLLAGRWESAVKRVVASGIVCGGCGAPLLFSWWDSRDDIGDGPFLIAAAVLAAFGVWMIARARREWMNEELG